jgi:hypothetical protein
VCLLDRAEHEFDADVAADVFEHYVIEDVNHSERTGEKRQVALGRVGPDDLPDRPP